MEVKKKKAGQAAGLSIRTLNYFFGAIESFTALAR